MKIPELLKSISMVIEYTFSDSYVRNQLPRKLNGKDGFIAYDQMIMPI
jgi:butyrate kinase